MPEYCLDDCGGVCTLIASKCFKSCGLLRRWWPTGFGIDPERRGSARCVPRQIGHGLFHAPVRLVPGGAVGGDSGELTESLNSRRAHPGVLASDAATERSENGAFQHVHIGKLPVVHCSLGGYLSNAPIADINVYAFRPPGSHKRKVNIHYAVFVT